MELILQLSHVDHFDSHQLAGAGVAAPKDGRAVALADGVGFLVGVGPQGDWLLRSLHRCDFKIKSSSHRKY